MPPFMTEVYTLHRITRIIFTSLRKTYTTRLISQSQKSLINRMHKPKQQWITKVSQVFVYRYSTYVPCWNAIAEFCPENTYILLYFSLKLKFNKRLWQPERLLCSSQNFVIIPHHISIITPHKTKYVNQTFAISFYTEKYKWEKIFK